MYVVKRRENGKALVRNEEAVLLAAVERLVDGESESHGYSLSQAIEASGRSMAYTTVYRCLDRLEERGLVASRWQVEDDSRRPRKVYKVTGAGIDVAQALGDAPDSVVQWRVT